LWCLSLSLSPEGERERDWEREEAHALIGLFYSAGTCFWPH